MNIQKAIEEQKGYMEGAKQVLAVLKQIEKKGIDCPFSLYSYSRNNEIIIAVRTLDELHDARVWLKDVFGSWEDKITNIFSSLGDGIARYRGTVDGVTICISLETPMDAFPKELMKDGCHFEKTTVDDYNFVCKTT